MAAWGDVLKQRAAAAAGGVSPPAPAPAPPAGKPIAQAVVVQVHADGSADVRLIACPMCRRPVDGDGCCWKCVDRRCTACKKKWTGSAFIQLCRPCEVEWRRREGMPL